MATKRIALTKSQANAPNLRNIALARWLLESAEVVVNIRLVIDGNSSGWEVSIGDPGKTAVIGPKPGKTCPDCGKELR